MLKKTARKIPRKFVEDAFLRAPEDVEVPYWYMPLVVLAVITISLSAYGALYALSEASLAGYNVPVRFVDMLSEWVVGGMYWLVITAFVIQAKAIYAIYREKQE